MEGSNVTKPPMSRIGSNSFTHIWSGSTTDVSTVVDISLEPVVVLNKHFSVIAANEPFYKTFKTDAKHTEGKSLFTLGEGQWDLPSLKILLEGILPEGTHFRGFEMKYESPVVGQKMLLLSGRQIYQKGAPQVFPSAIMLAMEDITAMTEIAEKLARHTQENK
jgi:hypothetical protein